MRIAVCGGPYGNPYALRAFVDDARARGAQRLYCLGDLGGFGAEVDALWPILTGADVTCVAGNYDVAVARGDTDCGCGYRDPKDNEFAQLIYDHTLATTSRDFAAWMGALPTERRETLGGVDVHMVHGSTLALNDFWWESLPEEQHRLRAAASGAGVVLCTHSGLSLAEAGRRHPRRERRSARQAGQRREAERLVRAARPRRGARRGGTRPLDYDWRAQAASMRAAGLPEVFVETIETGWWTTCLEVLPPAERSRGRYHLYRSTLPTGFRPADDGWGSAPGADLSEDRPVVPLFGSAYFPVPPVALHQLPLQPGLRLLRRRLVPQGGAARADGGPLPRARRRGGRRGLRRAVRDGGEPFLHPDIVALLDYASAQLPTVVMTNAMLLRGRRATGGPRRAQADRADLAGRGHGRHPRPAPRCGLLAAHRRRYPPPDRPGAAAAGRAHRDAREHRGGPRDRCPAGRARTAGGPLRGAAAAAARVRRDRRGDRRGHVRARADGERGRPALAPRGRRHGHQPDMHLAPAGTPLERGKELVTERFFAARLADGSLPARSTAPSDHCAI